MDPISQGTVGVAFAQSSASKNNILKISLIGLIAGLAPDADVVIKSSTDPILFLEYHRQFSHSLVFIPFGALVVAILFFPFFKNSLDFKQIYLASFLGYLTHGILDACTSYGTLLYWPISNERITWNNISIVDPILTIPILIFVISAIKTKKKLFSYFAIIWTIFYLSLGVLQYERALIIANKLALSRGHNSEKLTLKPSFGNIILWKSIYYHKGYFYVDAIRVFNSSTWCSGDSIKKFEYQYHLPNLEINSQQRSDIERFRWFSQDYLGFDDENKLLTDLRYSMIPNQISPMWGIIIDDEKSANEHAIWWTSRNVNQDQLTLFSQMLFGKKCRDNL